MSELAPINSYLAFAQDPDARVRAAALGILANSPDFESLSLMIRAFADPAEEVRNAAAECLRFALPWLGLWPMQFRPVPPSCEDHRFGKAWHQLSLALDGAVDVVPSPNFHDPAWRRVPLLGSLVEAARASRRSVPAALSDSFLYPVLSADRPDLQAIFIPTYACNITCSYCYARSWAVQHGRLMTDGDRRLALDWCARQGIKTLLLGGGEPTVYPAMPDLVAECRERNIALVLTSNGLFGRRIRDLLTPTNFREYIAHYDQESLEGSPDRRERFRENIAHAQTAGVPVRLRFTLTDRTDSLAWQRALDLAADRGIKTVNFGLAFQNSDGDNRFLDLSGSLQPGGWMEQLLRDFVLGSLGRGLNPFLCKPFPLCGVSDETLRLLGSSEALRTSCALTWQGCTRNLTINPDLTTFPCNAIGLTGPRITDLPTLADASQYYQRLMEPVIHRPTYAVCACCPLHFLGVCKPSCNAREVALSLARQAN